MRDVVKQPELVLGAQRRPSEHPRTIPSLQRVRALQKGGHRHSLGKQNKTLYLLQEGHLTLLNDHFLPEDGLSCCYVFLTEIVQRIEVQSKHKIIYH